jgi:hypothetical protein
LMLLYPQYLMETYYNIMDHLGLIQLKKI